MNRHPKARGGSLHPSLPYFSQAASLADLALIFRDCPFAGPAARVRFADFMEEETV
jgi:hypothetical protein